MSKYEILWKHLESSGEQLVKLSFAQIQGILGFEIDHSFLNYKKELTQYGYQVGKISLKEKTVIFNRID